MGAVLANTCGDSTSWYEQPDYEVVSVHDGYELRRYPQSMWTTVNVTATDSESEKEVSSRSFMTLFDYIRGKTNTEQQKVSMTVPVLMAKHEPSSEEMRFTMSFFLPKKNQDHPPHPTNDLVDTETKPSFEVYVRKFSPPSMALEHYLENKTELVDALARDDVELNDDYSWLRAGYDPPFKLCNRRSEVWIPKDQAGARRRGAICM